MARTNWKVDLLKTSWLQMHSVAFISMDFTTNAGPMYVHVHTCGAVHAFVYISMFYINIYFIYIYIAFYTE